MNNSAPAPGWWKASDGIWHPPPAVPPKATQGVDAAPSVGWVKGADGLWHPPPKAGDTSPAATTPSTRPATVSPRAKGTVPPPSASGPSRQATPKPAVGSATQRIRSTPTVYANGAPANSSGLSTTTVAWMVVGAVALVIVIAIAAIASSTAPTNDAATVARPSSEGTTPDEPADPQPEQEASSGGAQRPVNLGDDPYFDGLAESCFEGALTDCDLLYRQSEVGSDYEAYGATCGGRDLDATTPGDCDAISAIEPQQPSPQPPPPTTVAPSPPTSPPEPAPGAPCQLGSFTDCIDPDGDGEGTYLLDGADCMATFPGSPGLCTDLDGDGYAGYPDSG